MVRAPAAAIVLPAVPRLWPGETVVCLGTGPSLTREDVAWCHGRARVLAIKDAIDLAPWADVLYGAGHDNPTGERWWHRKGPSLAAYQGLRYTLDPQASAWATVLRQTGPLGLDSDPTGLRTGANSGYQAINLAVHLGASRILLLGYDMQPDAQGRDHFFGAHPHKKRPPFAEFVKRFSSLIEPLRECGVTVLNCSRVTKLACFPRADLREALRCASTVAA